ncbi:MAG: TetR/AcrR family transcriptional regulator [Spongiibacteraceae bacterium]
MSKTLVKRSTRPGAKTRDGILDAAEKLFAEYGYDGTSMRDIAAAAEAELGTLGYHFTSKENIFANVLQRRSPDSAEVLRGSLIKARQTFGDQLSVEKIIEAFSQPQFAMLHKNDPGHLSYQRIVTQRVPVENNGKLHAAIAEYYLPVRELYLEALETALPGATKSKLDWGFSLFELSFGNTLFGATRHRLGLHDMGKRELANLERDHIALFTAAFLQMDNSSKSSATLLRAG